MRTKISYSRYHKLDRDALVVPINILLSKTNNYFVLRWYILICVLLVSLIFHILNIKDDQAKGPLIRNLIYLYSIIGIGKGSWIEVFHAQQTFWILMFVVVVGGLTAVILALAGLAYLTRSSLRSTYSLSLADWLEWSLNLHRMLAINLLFSCSIEFHNAFCRHFMNCIIKWLLMFMILSSLGLDGSGLRIVHWTVVCKDGTSLIGIDKIWTSSFPSSLSIIEVQAYFFVKGSETRWKP